LFFFSKAFGSHISKTLKSAAKRSGTLISKMVNANMFSNSNSDLKVQPCMPDDVANMLLFFASDESRAITGQTIVADFGSTL